MQQYPRLGKNESIFHFLSSIHVCGMALKVLPVALLMAREYPTITTLSFAPNISVGKILNPLKKTGKFMKTLIRTASGPIKIPSPSTKGMPLYSNHSIAGSNSARAQGTFPEAKLE